MCDRCKQPGHHIKDCPENGNTYFDPCQNRGVPKQHIWKKQLNLNDEFQRNAGNVIKSLLKNNEIYSLEEEIEGKPSQEGEVEKCPPSLACELCQ